jgi:hypothetical protein
VWSFHARPAKQAPGSIAPADNQPPRR